MLIPQTRVVTLPIVCGPAPSNSCQHLTAARLPRPGLKPLVHSEMRDVIPLADRVAFVELNPGKRLPSLPHARGGSLQVR